MQIAPIILFVYDRPDHTERTIDALKKNDLAAESDLYIFADAAKPGAGIRSRNNIYRLHKILQQVSGFRSVNITWREKNFGLAANIQDGVTSTVEKYGKVIVLEDDIETSPHFLKFMNNALDLYEKHESVMHISGFMLPISGQLPELFFIRQTNCWGWATWKRAWKHYNPDASFLLGKFDTSLKQKFNLQGSYNFIEQLEANVNKTLTTWAIKWYASVFFMNGLALHPGTSLTTNIGLDGSGENCVPQDASLSPPLKDIEIEIKEIELKVDEKVEEQVMYYYRHQNDNRKEPPGKIQHYTNIFKRKIVQLILAIDSNIGLPGLKLKLLLLKWQLQIKLAPSARIEQSTAIELRHGGSVEIGENTKLSAYVTIHTYGGDVIIGKNSGISAHTTIYGHDGVMIGEHVLIGEQCILGNKDLQDKGKKEIVKGIIIEDKVCIESGCRISNGVRIGTGAIIKADSLVEKDVPANIVFQTLL